MSKRYTKEEIEQTREFDPKFAELMEEINASEEVSNDSSNTHVTLEERLASAEDPQKDAEEAIPDQGKGDTGVVESVNTVESEPTKDVDYWKRRAEETEKENEVLEKRMKDSQSALTPTLQANSELRKEIDSLKEELASLKSSISAPSKSSESTDVLEEEEDDDFTKEIVAKATKKLERQLEAKLKPIEEHRIKLEKSGQEEADRNKAYEHYKAVKSVHSDIDDYLGIDASKKLGPALLAWASEQKPWVLKAVQNPPDNDPDIVSEVITKFKNEAGLSKKTVTPSLGDIAQATPSNTKTRKEEVSIKPLTEYEQKHIDRLMATAASKSDGSLEELLKRLSVTQSK